jgi:hypothetical protein
MAPWASPVGVPPEAGPGETSLSCGNAEEATWGKSGTSHARTLPEAWSGTAWRHLTPPGATRCRRVSSAPSEPTPETGTAAAAEPLPDGAGQAVPGPMSRPRVRVTRAAAGQPPSAPPHASPHPCGPADSPEHHRARSAAPANRPLCQAPSACLQSRPSRSTGCRPSISPSPARCSLPRPAPVGGQAGRPVLLGRVHGEVPAELDGGPAADAVADHRRAGAGSHRPGSWSAPERLERAVTATRAGARRGRRRTPRAAGRSRSGRPNPGLRPAAPGGDARPAHADHVPAVVPGRQHLAASRAAVAVGIGPVAEGIPAV